MAPPCCRRSCPASARSLSAGAATPLPFLIPVAIGLVWLAYLLVTRDVLSIAATFADADVVGTILVLELVVLALRVAAVGAVLVDRRFARLRPRDALPIALLAAFVILPQVGLAAYTQQLQKTDQAMFGPSIGDNGVDDNAPFPTISLEPFDTPDPSAGASQARRRPARRPARRASRSCSSASTRASAATRP